MLAIRSLHVGMRLGVGKEGLAMRGSDERRARSVKDDEERPARKPMVIVQGEGGSWWEKIGMGAG